MHSISPLRSNQPATSVTSRGTENLVAGQDHAHTYAAAMVAIAAGIAAAAGVMGWLHVFQYETTDDAFVDARTVSRSARRLLERSSTFR